VSSNPDYAKNKKLFEKYKDNSYNKEARRLAGADTTNFKYFSETPGGMVKRVQVSPTKVELAQMQKKKLGGSLKPVDASKNPGLAKLPTHVRNKMGYAKKGGSAHPGFKAVQSSIAKKQGVSKQAAGAILAASTRKASAAAKRANPNLKKVKG